MHARWVIYLKKFTYVFKHKAGQLVNALRKSHELLLTLNNVITSFESPPNLYLSDEDFAIMWEKMW